jgi:PncC family amidohydrolase
MRPVARTVVVGLSAGAAAEAAERVAAALRPTGLPAGGWLVVEPDEESLRLALGVPSALTVVVCGPGRATGEVVGRAVEDATGRPTGPGPGARPSEVGVEGRSVAVGDREVVVVVADEEFDRALAEQVVPRARARARGFVAVRTLRVAGVTVRDVEERLGDWLAAPSEAVRVRVVAAPAETWVRLEARAATEAAAREALDAADAKIAGRLGEDCFGRDDETLEQVVGRLLLARGAMLAVAESCTGGLLGHRLTGVPGSSAWFERGVTVYSNRAKEELLGVPADVLRAHGAVSAPCVEAMVHGVRRLAGADCGLAVTGIAGPSGGTPAKPVGTVFVGVAVGPAVSTHHFLFAGDRASVKWQSAQAALDLLRRQLAATPRGAPADVRCRREGGP